MGISRACQPCKIAKTKCDLRVPSCGCCRKRQTTCHGYPANSGYIFRDQNETAKVNSERARRAVTRKSRPKLSIEASGCVDGPVSHISHDSADRPCYRHAVFRCSDFRCCTPTIFISIPRVLESGLEDQVLGLFYQQWILNPHDGGHCPGHLDSLPAMKAEATPLSPLNLAVEAFALANARHVKITRGSLARKSFHMYGQALLAISSAVAQQATPTNDATLMAILIIDMFEVMCPCIVAEPSDADCLLEIVFMVRREPLRLHGCAIEQLLAARGSTQMLSERGRYLFRMANRRLQVRQLGLGLAPLPIQVTCTEMMDASAPGTSLTAIQVQIQQAVSLVPDMLAQISSAESSFEQLHGLVCRLRKLLAELEHWHANLPASCTPKYIQLADHPSMLRSLMAWSAPYSASMYLYEDPSIAHEMTFFYQGQLAVRSALLETLATLETAATDEADRETLRAEIRANRIKIASINGTLAQSIIPLLLSLDSDKVGTLRLTGKKLTQCFARAVCWTLQQGKQVSFEHKDFADRVEDWMRRISATKPTI